MIAASSHEAAGDHEQRVDRGEKRQRIGGRSDNPGARHIGRARGRENRRIHRIARHEEEGHGEQRDEVDAVVHKGESP